MKDFILLHSFHQNDIEIYCRKSQIQRFYAIEDRRGDGKGWLPCVKIVFNDDAELTVSDKIDDIIKMLSDD